MLSGLVRGQSKDWLFFLIISFALLKARKCLNILVILFILVNRS